MKCSPSFSTLLLLLLLPVGLHAADVALPQPAFLVSGSNTPGATLNADLPTGLSGKVEGHVRNEGGELVFDGDGGKIVFDYDARGLFGFPFTVSTFVEPGIPKGYGEIIRSASPKGFSLRTSANGFYSVSTGGEWNALCSPARSLVQNARQHVAVVFDGTNLAIYLDGAEVARKELSGAPEAGMQVQVGDTGRSSDGDLTDVPNLRISQLAVYDSALTPEQIVALSRKK